MIQSPEQSKGAVKQSRK